MPPFVPRKRHLPSPPPAQEPPRKRPATEPQQRGKPTKRAVFDALDALDAAPRRIRTFEDDKAYLDALRMRPDEGGSSSSSDGSGSDSEAESESSSLSELSSDEFEDALAASASRRTAKRRETRDSSASEDEGAGEGEESGGEDWEDALPAQSSTTRGPAPSGDLEITLDGGTNVTWTDEARSGKKGPTKIERQIRIRTHCMHVQFLMWHNAIRNAWACDKEVQRILLDGLAGQIKKEVERWRAASGLSPGNSKGGDGGRSGKGADKRRQKGGKADKPARKERDWGNEAENLASNRADPLIRLLKFLAAYWKKKFKVTAPGLRKQGYKPLKVLEEEVKSFQNDPHDPETHGERVANLEEFRKLARKCEGSRDVGAQLFTALLRALGIEARLVASLQPSGFGWSAVEEAHPRKDHHGQHKERQQAVSIDVDANSGGQAAQTTSKQRKAKELRRGGKLRPIELEDSHSENDFDAPDSDTETSSIIELSRTSAVGTSPSKQFDKDLRFPIYWTEVLSPVTNTYIPLDALVLRTVANVPELLSAFEPRGKEAEKAKQGISYVIAYSSDGSAKDVTVRYLKRHMWPGKTKGARMPIEKIPVYNRHGKIKRYEEYDWFKTVMSGYERRTRKKPLAEEIEDSGDLRPCKPAAAAKTNEETLQGYKNSADFVLERHLRREEAILPNAKPVKTFVAGKGDKAKPEPVYRRKDIVACKTVESWHKEGRAIKVGEHPLKYVPMRAVTLIRKREVQETERHTGEKVMQGLYSAKQTEWIIPPPIVDGRIPRNAHGNMDVFVPSMIPRGAAHVPLHGTVRICKKLGIDFAEACTGFAFGRQRAVPVLTGVVVAAENRDMVIDAWNADQEQRQLKEQGKKELEALNMWKKFLTGLKIVSRMRNEYGGDENAHRPDELNPFTNRKLSRRLGRTEERSPVDDLADDEQHQNDPLVLQGHDEAELGGGFIREDSVAQEHRDGIPAVAAENSNDEPRNTGHSYPQTPISLQSGPGGFAKEALSDLEAPERPSRDPRLDVPRRKPKKPKLETHPEPAETPSDGGAMPTPPRKRGGRRRAVAAGPATDSVESRPQRSVPKRRAARKSETAIYSHYFDKSGDESGLGDESDEVDVGS